MAKDTKRTERDADETVSESATEAKPGLVKLPEPPPAKRTARTGYLLVATNPFCATDGLGRPSGACPVDPRDPRFYAPEKGMGEVRGFVGASRVVGDVTRYLDPREGEHCHRTERRNVEWEFEREPFEIPDTRFYRTQIRERALLDATQDYESARRLAKSRANCAVEPRWIQH